MHEGSFRNSHTKILTYSFAQATSFRLGKSTRDRCNRVQMLCDICQTHERIPERRISTGSQWRGIKTDGYAFKYLVNNSDVLLLLCAQQMPEWFSTFSSFATFIAFSNSLINPVIYGGFNRQFRQAILQLLRCQPTRVQATKMRK